MDAISEFITRIRNASTARHDKFDIPCSNLRVELARVLREEGFIRNFKVVKDGKQGMMRVYLRYDTQGKSVVSALKRVSRPSLRSYVRSDKIPKIRSGFGLVVLSTSKGIMSGEEARRQNVGGEYLFKVW